MSCPDPDPSFAAFEPARDPLADADPAHPGVAAMLAAAGALDAGDPAVAIEHAQQARRIGVPAELVPHRALLEGVALVLAGRAEEAVEVLGQAWGAHPDVAALPAALGAARIVAADATSAAHSMYAALVSDDPDRSLAIHRRRLTLLLAAVRAGGAG